MSAKRLDFGRVSRKASVPSRKIVLTRGDGDALKPKLAPNAVQGLDAKLREIEPGQRYELEVTVTPPFANDRLRASVRLQTGVPQAPITTIMVTAVTAPRVEPKPRRFTVPVKRLTDWEQSVRLVWDDDAPHKILSAKTDDPRVQVRVDENDGKQQVVLRVADNYKPASPAHVVTITTDDAEAPVVRVPIAGMKKARRPRGNRPSAPKRGSGKRSVGQTVGINQVE